MTDNDPRLQEAFAILDGMHREEPAASARQENILASLGYHQRLSQWVERLAPQASAALRLAARSQHVRRWSIPRDSYPMTRKGYRDWREALARFHTRTAAEVLVRVGYDAHTVTRVQQLLQKERLRTDLRSPDPGRRRLPGLSGGPARGLLPPAFRRKAAPYSSPHLEEDVPSRPAPGPPARPAGGRRQPAWQSRRRGVVVSNGLRPRLTADAAKAPLRVAHGASRLPPSGSTAGSALSPTPPQGGSDLEACTKLLARYRGKV